jgi:ABC-2 type transport system permease protein
MNLKRIGILLNKDIIKGPKDFLFIYALVGPVVISLVLTLVFGSLFSSLPRLAVLDEGVSRLPGLIAELDSVTATVYDSPAALETAVTDGKADIGITLPSGFDGRLAGGETVEISAFVWGESLARTRAVLTAVIAEETRSLAGREIPVEIVTTALGDAEEIPWGDRLLPLVVIMAVVMGGTMVPATSLVDEKMKRTLRALAITPTTLWDIFLAKGLMGAILGTFTGVLILDINQAFGAQPWLLVGVLALGSLLAAALGVVFGAIVKDITTLFALLKGIGILLYAPAFVYMFPGIPQWIGRIFPTYYILNPVVEISQQGAGWAEIAPEVFILLGLIIVVTVIGVRMGTRMQRSAA